MPLQRFWRFLKARLHRRMDDWEDPEVLLAQAQREMTEMHARNRERVVQTITQKNNLQQMVDDIQKRVADLQREADEAQQRGERDIAARLRHQQQRYEEMLALTRESLAQAEEIVEVVKTAIRREEETIRRKTAEALALRAEWTVRVIRYQMERARDDAERAAGTAAPLPLSLEEQRRRRQRRLRVYRQSGERTPETRRERLRQLAQEERTEQHTRLRGHAVEAITAKNNLFQMRDDARERVENLRVKADAAARRGDDNLWRQLLAEAEQREATLAYLEAAAARTHDLGEQIKAMVRRDEERLRLEWADTDGLIAEIEAEVGEEDRRQRLASVLATLIAALLTVLLSRRRPPR